MADPHKIPYLAADLIKQLDEQYPHRTPCLEETERSIFYYAGIRELIDVLKARLAEDETHDPDQRIL